MWILQEKYYVINAQGFILSISLVAQLISDVRNHGNQWIICDNKNAP
jgi:hypothetical protein